eukprot:TRINITY_DN2037_c0_g1_i1.p1 TRINITY_DN2037_c0_g1~~TRINITY_DN2037_c0_g1_i1.p1  ORF type:complete len:220 (+),score=63.88 TRINITY_DN2037_c0_g1_i1:363-1022(+)
MMTPRSVAIQNKDFMVNVKYGGQKSSLKVTKDTTIDQLKQKICDHFKICEADQGLAINGKPIPASSRGTVTLAQAKIPNGCKILVSNLNTTTKDSENIVYNPSAYSDDKSKDDRTSLVLSDVERKGLEISRTVKMLEEKVGDLAYKSCDLEEVKGYKKTAAVQGELLMQGFECLDRLDLATSNKPEAHKKKRKELANLLNSILDRNDQVMAAFTKHLKS